MPVDLLTSDQLSMLQHLLGALTAGGLIGLERSYHGRPAGFRTHALVCVASSMLMLVLPRYESFARLRTARPVTEG